MFDAYQNEFGGEPEAKETILFGRDLLERVENEMTPMVNSTFILITITIFYFHS